MQQNQPTIKEDICESFCRCQICLAQQQLTYCSENFPQKSLNINCLHIFLQYFPKNFPLEVCSTALACKKLHYYNKFQQNRLSVIPYSYKITEHLSLFTNITVFYQNKSIVIYKYELIRQSQDFLYVQGYTPEPACIIKYNQHQNLMDNILLQKLETIIEEIMESDNFTMSQRNVIFLEWVYKEYGESIFCQFMTHFYCQFIKYKYRDIINKGVFEWHISQFKSMKLANVTDLVISQYRHTQSFQQEFQCKIKQQIHSKKMAQIQLFSGVYKRKQPYYRLNNFRKNIKDIYHRQKLAIIQQTKKQRGTQTKSMSDDVARLFLPDLKNYSSLREVLNDEQKFRKVVLGEKSRKQSPSKTVKCSGRHLRSKTEI